MIVFKVALAYSGIKDDTAKGTRVDKLLAGLRILDIGRYVAGPYCATLLGYLGADVIRVERRTGGEDRYIAPLFEDTGGTPGTGGLFMQTGCGKKSVTLNLSQDKGREILRRLAATCDVVVANLPPAALEKLGLDWDSFSAAAPGAVLVTQSAFGSRGPGRDKGGFDGIGQAMSGAMYLTGTPDAPAKAGAPYVDFSTALFSTIGTLAALMDRTRTGRGQWVETTLLGSALAAMNAHLAEQAVTGRNRPGTGNRVQTSAPSDVFRTTDGHILVHTVGDGLFARWAKLVGRPDLIEDPRFKGDQARGDARDFLCGIMADWCAGRTMADALDALDAAGVPSGPVLTQQQALDNPLAHALHAFRAMAVPGHTASAPVADIPIRFSALDAGVETPPPALGADTDTVLEALGIDAAARAALRDDGVI
ncbi:crotonobetainyl-CoA:carnitine CoA-transferase CaiB-like acyl-CoA transferase [Eilatimonas milleporae]|uniref:Crotonobetainyl-CoA:carnitine CoA-transferase CaiB-like acyl-CoA transferase n=1 Tax=Eilatimonas milleporae TaxID=911205 RepID=A0A3M0CT49_9PROT|nr:crotonobetainyl-CoA:carnitine CoA-transferase CaiB-like acyl-CoA transferase [Eilatimonas milleporae]